MDSASAGQEWELGQGGVHDARPVYRKVMLTNKHTIYHFHTYPPLSQRLFPPSTTSVIFASHGRFPHFSLISRCPQLTFLSRLLRAPLTSDATFYLPPPTLSTL
jgi:hypothetical protein